MKLCISWHFTTDTFFGTMYTSDDRGIVFSKSLERHLFGGQRKSDFTNITSLRGAYLTNRLDLGTVSRCNRPFTLSLLFHYLLCSTVPS